MKFIVTMKTPDALNDAILDALERIDNEEVREETREGMEHLASRYIKYGEYMRVEFDTQAGTATLLEARR